MRETPDESVDLLRGQLLAAIFASTATARRHSVRGFEALSGNLEAVNYFEVRVHASTPRCRLTDLALSCVAQAADGR
jgi:hypothetical protein